MPSLDAPADFKLMKFDSSDARDNEDIEVSSIVCIELKMNNELISTTRANIFASCVGFF